MLPLGLGESGHAGDRLLAGVEDARTEGGGWQWVLLITGGCLVGGWRAGPRPQLRVPREGLQPAVALPGHRYHASLSHREAANHPWWPLLLCVTRTGQHIDSNKLAIQLLMRFDASRIQSDELKSCLL